MLNLFWKPTCKKEVLFGLLHQIHTADIVSEMSPILGFIDLKS